MKNSLHDSRAYRGGNAGGPPELVLAVLAWSILSHASQLARGAVSS